MSVLSNNEVFAPFLSKPMSFIKGLDPLGLQNTSEATFSLLLPGLNNVTGRIRFYSFYCWLLQEYAKRIGSTDPADQRKFIRRAELIIALVNRSTEDEVAGIPGSLYANRQLKEDLKVYDLELGTYNKDRSTEHTYWKNPGGAFGQYYLGSLMDIGLISLRDRGSLVYVRTAKKDGIAVSGEDLAEAFDENITAHNKNKFFNCISKGIIKASEFDALFQEFNLSAILIKSRERTLLLKLLIEKDFPQMIEEETLIYRKSTVTHLLEFAKNNQDLTDRNFTLHAYFNKGIKIDIQDDCLTGWYYYQLNEFWQYSCLGIFNGAMDYLEKVAGSSWKNLNQLVDEVTNLTLKVLKEEEIIEHENEQIKHVLGKIEEEWVEETELFQLIRDENNIKRVAYSFMLILSLFKNNTANLERLKSFGVNHEIEKDGDSITYFLKFEKHLQKSIKDFIKEFLFINIIYRHQFVAFRKMGSGILSTQLFIIEDGLIRRLKNFDPTLTGPRITRLLRFLTDLHILKDAELTKEGSNLLNQLSNEAT